MRTKHFLMDQTTEGAGGSGGAAPVTPPAGAAPNAGWLSGVQGIDAELSGHIAAKGWDKLDATQAAIAAAKSHREAQQYVGAPADKLLRLPNDPNDAKAMDAIYQRLGKPSDPKEYDFSAIKLSDGEPLDNSLQDMLRQSLHKYNMTKNDGVSFAADLAKFFDGVEQNDKAISAAKLTQEKDQLSKLWGNNMEANKFIAQAAVRRLGIDPETVNTLESVVGYSKVMEMFRQIGKGFGEDVVFRTSGGSDAVMTTNEAIARRADLMKDAQWVQRYTSGGQKEMQEMQAINRLIAESAR